VRVGMPTGWGGKWPGEEKTACGDARAHGGKDDYASQQFCARNRLGKS
jgi:hypothetical protein